MQTSRYWLHQESDNEFDRPLPILAQYWDWQNFGDQYLPDITEPGSWLDMYWWRVIHQMKVEYDNAKAEGDDNPSGATDGPVKRPKNAPRKKPVLPSQRRKS